MSIMEIMFIKLFYSQCSVCLSKRFFCWFRNIVKLRKRKREHFNSFERKPKKTLVACSVRNSTF